MTIEQTRDFSTFPRHNPSRFAIELNAIKNQDDITEIIDI